MTTDLDVIEEPTKSIFILRSSLPKSKDIKIQATNSTEVSRKKHKFLVFRQRFGPKRFEIVCLINQREKSEERQSKMHFLCR